MSFLGGIAIDLVYGLVMAGVFLLLFQSLPGDVGLVKLKCSSFCERRRFGGSIVDGRRDVTAQREAERRAAKAERLAVMGQLAAGLVSRGTCSRYWKSTTSRGTFWR